MFWLFVKLHLAKSTIEVNLWNETLLDSEGRELVDRIVWLGNEPKLCSEMVTVGTFGMFGIFWLLPK